MSDWTCQCTGCTKARKQGREEIIEKIEDCLRFYSFDQDLIATAILRNVLDKLKK